MSKIVIFLLFLAITVNLCYAWPGRYRGRERHRKDRRWMHQDRHRRPWGHGELAGPPRGFGRWKFDVGPNRDPWFGLDFSWGHPMNEPEPWWSGPNVCRTVSEGLEEDRAEISPHGMFRSIVCDDSETSYKCTKSEMTPFGLNKTVEVYECCPGFTRRPDDFGCPDEVPLYDIPTLMENLQLTELMQLLDTAGLVQDVLSKDTANFTIFAPTNEAIKEFLPLLSEMDGGVNLTQMNSLVMVSPAISDAVIDNTKNLLLGHVAVDRVTSAQISDNQIIETASPLKTSVRMNTYQRPVQIVTANCKRVTSVDNMATNGVIHVVEDVLKPVSDSIMDLVQKNPELSSLKTVLGSSRLGSVLREDGQFTLFAPTNKAFENHRAIMQKISSNQDCVENVLKNHLLPNVICSAVISGQARSPNSLGKHSNLTRDSDDKLYVDGAQIVAADIMATNGVLYIVDDILIPDEALNILQLAEKLDLSEFGKLVDLAGMKKELANAENVTVFVPSNEAIKALPSSVLNDLSKDQDALQNILKYHVVPSIQSCRTFYNNLELDTLQGTSLRVNEYSLFPFGRHYTRTVQCATVEETHIKGCNAAVFVIDKVIIPPVGDVVDVLAQDKRLSTLVELLKTSGLADQLQGAGLFTIFAPTNQAFNALGSDAVAELKQNKDTLKSILLNHVTKDSICCAGVVQSNWFDTQKVRTLSGKVFEISKRRNGIVQIANSDVSQCDLTATNGVVHVIDDVITNQRRRRPWDWVWDF